MHLWSDVGSNKTGNILKKKMLKSDDSSKILKLDNHSGSSRPEMPSDRKKKHITVNIRVPLDTKMYVTLCKIT